MSIRKTVRELRGMAENLEASGFNSGQAQSTIEAIAVSIERFAVTPEVLAREFAKQNEAIGALITRRFTQFREEIDRRFAQHNEALGNRMTGQLARFREEFDRRFTEQSKGLDHRAAARDKAWDTRFAEQNVEMNRQFTELRAEIESVGTRQFAMMWSMIVMMLGLLAINFV